MSILSINTLPISLPGASARTPSHLVAPYAEVAHWRPACGVRRTSKERHPQEADYITLIPKLLINCVGPEAWGYPATADEASQRRASPRKAWRLRPRGRNSGKSAPLSPSHAQARVRAVYVVLQPHIAPAVGMHHGAYSTITADYTTSKPSERARSSSNPW